MNKQFDADEGGLNNVKKLFAILLLIAITYLSYQAVLTSVIYLNHYHVNATLDQWYENKKPVSLSDWQELEIFAISSLHINEDNTAMLNALARVYDYRSAKMARSINDRLFYGEKSIQYYRMVIGNRPAWPYGWMNLAQVKARLGRLDDEFKQALFQLLKTGPWERLTLPVIIQLGLFSWHNLDDDSHQLLLDYFLVAQDERAVEVLNMLQSTGQMTFYCRLVMQRDAKAMFCR